MRIRAGPRADTNSAKPAYRSAIRRNGARAASASRRKRVRGEIRRVAARVVVEHHDFRRPTGKQSFAGRRYLGFVVTEKAVAGMKTDKDINWLKRIINRLN